MALRAGYYGVKRFLRNKLETIAGTYDDTIKSLFSRSEQAVLGAKNIIIIDGSSSGIFTINDDKTVTVNGSGTSERPISVYKDIPSWLDNCYLSGGKSADKMLVISFRNAGGTWLGDINNISGDTKIIVPDTAVKYQIKLVIGDVTLENEVFYPMISFDGGEYVSPAMTNKQLTDSAADQKTAINAIITAATGAADFAAFKTAMGAITPVTRSLSLTKEDITEEVKEEEPEKIATKKRTTKKTEEV